MLISFFFNDTATTEIYTLSLHDALPISPDRHRPARGGRGPRAEPQVAQPAVQEEADRPPLVRGRQREPRGRAGDRKSTRLNSSHANISYAVFCLKKKKNTSESHDTHI